MIKQLNDLRNVGNETIEGLHLLNIYTVDELAKKDPTVLFHELEERTHRRQNPCVWDVFASIIHEAAHSEPTDWWEWTARRKALQKKGLLNHVI